jgi:hypothetical protein
VWSLGRFAFGAFAPLPWRLIAATLAVSAAAVPASVVPAAADYIRSSNCVGAAGMSSCITRWSSGGDPHIIEVPQPLSQDERDRAAARDRKWVARCKPVIHQDRYGVPRYYYAAPGCEFGRIGD